MAMIISLQQSVNIILHKVKMRPFLTALYIAKVLTFFQLHEHEQGIVSVQLKSYHC
ncbi:hypothetical protein OQ038_0486 [Haemophilus influenzae]|nr:hypothetical protein BV189_0487 [Haemophilus influenzae]WCN74296.1 hypothetical protein BV187_0484 [Haemophilus influenzae]WCO83562.1 hypothetical protein OQ038_0486 [Haemophilus influenzae]WCO85259.1 hypothetical protein OQ039_0485 [Haemophilus influenzae]